jgi:hypothetical protein
MELLEGCSLAELIQTHRRLDPGLAVWIVRQALAGWRRPTARASSTAT